MYFEIIIKIAISILFFYYLIKIIKPNSKCSTKKQKNFSKIKAVKKRKKFSLFKKNIKKSKPKDKYSEYIESCWNEVKK